MPSAADSQAVDARVRRTPAKSTPPKAPEGLGAKVMQMPPAKTGAGAGTGATAKLPMPMLANTSKSKSIAKPPMHPPAKSPGRPRKECGPCGDEQQQGQQGQQGHHTRCGKDKGEGENEGPGPAQSPVGAGRGRGVVASDTGSCPAVLCHG